MAVFASTLAGLKITGGVLNSLAGLDNSAAERQAYEQNVMRVAQIDAENQRRLFDQLQVNSAFNNRKANIPANLDSINITAARARAESQKKIDEAVDSFMFDNQDRYVRLAQKMSGNRTGRANVTDSALAAQMGRADARSQYKRDQLIDAKIGSDTRLAENVRNARSKELAGLGSSPVQNTYIDSYTPMKAQQKGFGDYLNMASGMVGAVMGGLETFDKFKPKSPLEGGLGNSLKIAGSQNLNKDFWKYLPQVGFTYDI